jgi:hypothetical protein
VNVRELVDMARVNDDRTYDLVVLLVELRFAICEHIGDRLDDSRVVTGFKGIGLAPSSSFGYEVRHLLGYV